MNQPPFRQDVVVRDIEMGFGSMVMFMVKWTIASIPAFIILMVMFLLAASVVGGVVSGIVSG